MPKYTVRDAENWEVFRLVEITEAVLLESVYSHITYDKEKSANYIMDGILKRPGTFLRVIADESDKIAGGIFCVCEKMLFSQDKVAYDITIMIDEEHRGRCLKQLIQIIEEYKTWAIAEGAKIIKMGVSSGINIDKASQFFEVMGFERVGAMHSLRVGA